MPEAEERVQSKRKIEEKRPIMRCAKSALWIESESSSPGGRGTWYCRAPVEHTLEDVLAPEYFGQMQSERALRVGDVIDIEPEHALWFIRVRVMALLPSIAQVRVREITSLRQSWAVKSPDGYSFVWSGHEGRWTIKRGEVVVDGGFITQDDALARIEELQREKAA